VEFDREHSRQRFCGRVCAREARLLIYRERGEGDRARKAESTRRGEILRRLRLQEIKVAEAQRRLLETQEEVRSEGLSETVVDEQRFELEAAANAANVTANRAHDFLAANEAFFRERLVRWGFSRGLTKFDLEAIWAQLLGHPRPIIIEAERPVSFLDFLDDEAEEEDVAA